MSDMPTLCEHCGKDINEIAGIDGYFVDEFPVLLHPECYRELSEKAWKYDQLN